jgi:Fe/S biogenesis protein NfuA
MMLAFTDTARAMVRSFGEYVDNAALRVAIAGGSPFAPRYELTIIEESEQEPGDVVFDAGGFLVMVDAASAERLRGATIDYLEAPGGGGFEVKNPNVATPENTTPTGPLAERVRQVIEERVNPGVAAHGGEINLVTVEDDIAYITMHGGCQGCAMSKITLRQGIERMIREVVPEIVGVQDVTDHVSGTNPYSQ